MKSRNILLIAVALMLVSSTVAGMNLKTSDAFKQMKSLVGVWHKESSPPNSNFSISFELTANDTVLVETWLNNGNKHSLTIYHLNNDNLIATHYCPQGNQPRLKLTKNSSINDLSFVFLDATNLNSLDDSHQHSLGFEVLIDNDKIRRKESYLSKSGESLSELILVRSQASTNKQLH